ncbi:polyisoprenoid-binding protein [Polymorphobacter glacialis]|uniref:Polyisoprenoid-binding protein n=1 Tax=Sandarakinorhabdus glacialis TaxID=1614636 RepID=A0A917E4L2_9SPHN|nr:YceI family protein [Polymorphobacter glacialis]GGE03020.1 polyisoprenoid-binding protein [Polymorphobacter glacialis]
MKFTALAVALVLAAPLSAQVPGVPGTSSPATVQAGTYKVDTSHTLVRFQVSHMGFSDFFGTFPGATGTLSLDPKNIAAAKLDISVPVATVSTTNATLDEELRGPEWIDAGKFPAMRFVSTKITQTGPKTAKIAGTITMHGITKPLVLDASFVGVGTNPMSKTYTTGFNAVGTLKRSDFGVAKYVPLISDKVEITIAVAFDKTK